MQTGLRNASANFQALINAIFGHFIDVFIVIYVDDIGIFNYPGEEHLHGKVIFNCPAT